MYRRAAEADPLSISVRANLGIACINYPLLGEAEEQLRYLQAIEPDSDATKTIQGWLALRKGNANEALDVFLSMASSHRYWGACFAYFDLGRQAESDQALADLIETSSSYTYQVGGAYAYQGRVDEAFDWLDRALQQKDPWLADLGQFFGLANLYEDPRWPKLVSAVGLS